MAETPKGKPVAVLALIAAALRRQRAREPKPFVPASTLSDRIRRRRNG